MTPTANPTNSANRGSGAESAASKARRLVATGDGGPSRVAPTTERRSRPRTALDVIADRYFQAERSQAHASHTTPPPRADPPRHRRADCPSCQSYALVIETIYYSEADNSALVTAQCNACGQRLVLAIG